MATVPVKPVRPLTTKHMPSRVVKTRNRKGKAVVRLKPES